jgi:hypothetical protein
MDDYATPFEAVPPLVPYLAAAGIRSFAEPCCGDGDLCCFLESFGFECVLADDLIYGTDARSSDAHRFEAADAIITNPPWTRELLHPLIWHLSRIKPCWLLFDADWAHTRQAAALLTYCTDIVAIGRVRWIRDSPFTGKDNAAWHRFQRERALASLFHGRQAA